MQIYGPYRVSTTQPTSQPQRTQPQQPESSGAAKPPKGQVDQLDLSSAASDVNRVGSTQIAGGGEIRIDRVAEMPQGLAPAMRANGPIFRS